MWTQKEKFGAYKQDDYTYPGRESMWARTRGLSPLDPSSYSRPDLAKIIKMNIELRVDFDNKIFHGTNKLSIRKRHPHITKILLDIHNLKIIGVFEGYLKQMLKYTVSEPMGEFGSKLAIELPPRRFREDLYVVHVTYQTDRKASGLQWLDPEQTAGKQLPFVFTQFQAIHARSVIPCQDSPGIKVPFSATIAVPQGYVVVMSAPRITDMSVGNMTLSEFRQTIPVPPYLIAFAIGALESRQIGPRSHVWAEKELLDSAAYEFEDTETQLRTAEDICGAYEWGVYDLLVLPHSFPFGGMENPCLTFVTPTLLAGDKSLANVIAHEIAHSWTGNLVTNRNFEHFWLNEGFTVFVERKIIGRLKNTQEQDFEAVCGLGELKETINHLGATNQVTSLIVDLGSLHPDDAFSTVPYEKGHIFLRYLEDLVGGPDEFEPFLRSYFYSFKFKSIETQDFKEHFENYFSDTSAISQIDWNTWLHKPGMPPIIPNFDRTLNQRCTDLKKLLIGWNETSEQPPFTSEDFNVLSTNQLIRFLQEVLEEEPQSISKLQGLQNIFDFDRIQNSEIKFRWLRIGLKAHWEDKIPVALEWLSIIGRMKFVRPLYRDLYDWEKSRFAAMNNFIVQHSKMMHVVAYSVSQDLKLNDYCNKYIA